MTENVKGRHNAKRNESLRRKSDGELRLIVKRGSLSSACAEYILKTRGANLYVDE